MIEMDETFTGLTKKAKKKYVWWLAAFVTLASACIYNVDKLAALAHSDCNYLKKELNMKERKLKAIQQQIQLLNGQTDLKLSADSVSAATQIADLFSKLNKEKCNDYPPCYLC